MSIKCDAKSTLIFFGYCTVENSKILQNIWDTFKYWNIALNPGLLLSVFPRKNAENIALGFKI